MRKLTLFALAAGLCFAMASTASALTLSLVETTATTPCGAGCSVNDGGNLNFDLYINATGADTGIDGLFLSVGYDGGVASAQGVEATLFSGSLIGITGTAGFMQPILPGVGAGGGAPGVFGTCDAVQCTQYDYQSTSGSNLMMGDTFLGEVHIVMDGSSTGVVSFGIITPGLDSIQRGATSLDFDNTTYTIQGAMVPEPATAGLLAVGLVGLAMSGRRQTS